MAKNHLPRSWFGAGIRSNGLDGILKSLQSKQTTNRTITQLLLSENHPTAQVKTRAPFIFEFFWPNDSEVYWLVKIIGTCPITIAKRLRRISRRFFAYESKQEFIHGKIFLLSEKNLEVPQSSGAN